MDASIQFCPNLACNARGQSGQGTITIHSKTERRYRCSICQKTFRDRCGTVFAGLRKSETLVETVITLVAHGCPRQDIVAAYGLDERTVAAWIHRAGNHCQRVHDAMVLTGSQHIAHIQADAIRAKCRKTIIWLAMAIALPSHLWLGGVSVARRDSQLAQRLFGVVRRAIADLPLPILVQTDGWVAYPKAIVRAFRERVPSVRRGRPHLVIWRDLTITAMIKHTAAKRSVNIEGRIVRGGIIAVHGLLAMSEGGSVINTAFIERYNATLRQRLAVLARRSRHMAVQQATLDAGMFLVGTFYNFCWPHRSLRLHTPSACDRTWLLRTPAMAAGLTEHLWSVRAVLTYKVAPPLFVPPKRRGRPPKPKPDTVTV